MAMVARSDDAQRHTMATLLLGLCALVLLRGMPTASLHSGMFQRQSQPASAPLEAVSQGDLRGSTHSEPADAHLTGQDALLALDRAEALGRRNDVTLVSATAAALAEPVRPELRFKPRYTNDKLISEQVISWSGERKLNPLLVWTVIDAESNGNPRALSREGALGLMQVMPFHFRYGDDPFDIATNIKRGTGVLASYIAETGSVKLALAAYNAGPAAVRKYDGVPPYSETRRFVNKTFDRYVKLLDLAIAGGVDPFSLRYASDP